MAADALEVVHRATETALTESARRAWTDGPARALRTALAEGGRDDLAPALHRIMTEIEGGLIGSDLRAALTHGDAWLGNVVLDQDRGLVGLVDWASADDHGLTALDGTTLVVTARLDRHRAQLGEHIRELLATSPANRWEHWEAAILRRFGVTTTQVAVPQGPLTEVTALSLTWLHHVATNISKSGRFRPGTAWFTRNVEVVLVA